MIKTTGRFTAAFLSLLLSASITLSSFSANCISAGEDASAAVTDNTSTEDTNKLPEFYNIAGVIINVKFGQPKLFISVTIGGYYSTTYTDGKIKLEKLNGADTVTVKEWTNLSSSGYLFKFTDESVIASPGKYRLSISVTTIKDGIREVVSGYIDVTWDGTSKNFNYDFKLGDMDQNGLLRAVDLTVLMKIIAGKTTPSGFQNYLADVNGDGSINAKDLTRLMKEIASME